MRSHTRLERTRGLVKERRFTRLSVNPLSSAFSSLSSARELLNGGLEDAGNNRKFIEIILAHTVRLNNIASDLLVLSELDSGAALGPPEPIFLPDVVQSALHTLQSEAVLRGVRLRHESSQQCRVIGYRFRLEQALVNLLDNAVKFNRPDGEVAIDCGLTDDGWVRIAV